MATDTEQSQQEQPQAYRYALLALLVLLIGLAGLVGYFLYPRFDQPRAVGLGLLVLAAGAGIASFFSPCSFALLLSLLSRQAKPEAPKGERVRRSLVFAGSMAIGASVFVVGVGMLIALGGEAIAADVTFTSTAGRVLRIVVGVVLLIAALNQLGYLRLPTTPVTRLAKPFAKRSFIEAHPVPGFAIFGFGYLLAGFG